MDNKPLKSELEAAYKNLDKAYRQIQRLLVERRQNQLVFSLLETAKFIEEGKLEEAEGKLEEANAIARSFYAPTEEK